MQWTPNQSVVLQKESEVRSSNPQTQSSETPWQDQDVKIMLDHNRTKTKLHDSSETEVNNIYLSKEQEIMVN